MDDLVVGTARAACAEVDGPAVVCTASPPHHVVACNRAWEQLCGWSCPELIGEPLPNSQKNPSLMFRLECELTASPNHVRAGKGLDYLKGPATDPKVVKRLMEAVWAKESLDLGLLFCYDRHSQAFSHHVSVSPISSPCGSVELFRVVSQAASRPCPAAHASSSIDTCEQWDDDWDVPCGSSIDMTSSQLAALATHSQIDLEELQPASEWGAMGVPSPLSLSPSLVPPSPMSSPFVVAMHGEPPYHVLWASEAWLNLCGFESGEVLGGNLNLIQGPGTDRAAICTMMGAVRAKQPIVLRNLINYDKLHRPFRHTVNSVYVPPGAEDNEEGFFRAVSTGVARSSGGIFTACCWSSCDGLKPATAGAKGCRTLSDGLCTQMAHAAPFASAHKRQKSHDHSDRREHQVLG